MTLSLLDWLTVIGGSGGLVYWWDRWRERPRISVTVVDERSKDGVATVELEVENLSHDVNSLQAGFSFDGFTPTKKQEHYQFKFDPEADRGLEPFSPRRIEAKAKDEGSKFTLLWLRRYKVPATRGRTREVRLRWVKGPALGTLQYYLERVLFKYFGRLYKRLVKEDLEALSNEPICGSDVWESG